MERKEFCAQEQGSATGSAPSRGAPHLGDDGVKAALSPRVIPRIGVQHPAPANSRVQEFPPIPNQPLGAGLLVAGFGVTHQEKGCWEPGTAELAKNPAKICWIILKKEAWEGKTWEEQVK